MAYRVRIDPIAQDEIDKLGVYLRSYDEDFAIEQIDRLDRIIATNLGESPLIWSYFAFTGAPYRGYLFRVSRRTQFWIIYVVDEDARTVDILKFWNAKRDPETLDL